jgi:hypothetical protein
MVALRIERLVFDGVELTQRERAALTPAIEQALRHRFAGRAAPASARAGARVERLGGQIADAVYDRVPRAGGSR